LPSTGRKAVPVYDRRTLELLEWRSGPAGIVYHTTESNIAPFDEEHSVRLRRVGRWMLEYVRDNRSYHFVIDRFGRVHRIVREAGAPTTPAIPSGGRAESVREPEPSFLVWLSSRAPKRPRAKRPRPRITPPPASR